MNIHTGQCMCGAVRFEITDLREDFGACHCKMCQRWAGSALLAITVPAATIRWQGEAAIARYQSSDWAERGWCATCGSNLFYHVTADGPHKDAYEIPVGLLDDATGLRLTREIFIDRKPDCFALAGEHETLTEAQVMALYGITSEGA